MSKGWPARDSLHGKNTQMPPCCHVLIILSCVQKLRLRLADEVSRWGCESSFSRVLWFMLSSCGMLSLGRKTFVSYKPCFLLRVELVTSRVEFLEWQLLPSWRGIPEGGGCRGLPRSTPAKNILSMSFLQIAGCVEGPPSGLRWGPARGVKWLSCSNTCFLSFLGSRQADAQERREP